MDRTVVGIDVGSSKVCTLVGEVDSAGNTRIIGVGLVPSRGIRKGAVVSVTEATASIRASVDKAERTSGCRIERAYVSISGTHVSSVNNRGTAGISRRERGIRPEDVDRALEAARSIAVPQNRDVVHVIVRGYVVDGQTGVPDPVGMRGFRLEVETHIVTGGTNYVENLRQCVEGAGVQVDDMVAACIAAGDAVLTSAEREMGVVLADIGAGTTDVGLFSGGTVWHTAVLGIGGEYVTNDVAIGLRLQPGLAEQIKIQHGHAFAKLVAPDESFSVFPFAENTPQIVPRWKLAQIIQARVEEILLMVQQEIRRSAYDGLLPAGIVLGGGTAQLPGIQELAKEVFAMPVRIGMPAPLEGLVEVIANPAHAVGVGLMAWNGAANGGYQPSGSGLDVGGRLVRFVRLFLPD